MKFVVESVNISKRTGTPKEPVAQAEVIPGQGIQGDAHAGTGHRQVSFLAAEAVERMHAKGVRPTAGAFGENILTRGVDWTMAKPGDLIAIGSAEFEVTQIGKECHAPCAIFYAAGECIMPANGIFARVLKGGVIHAQDCGDYRIGPRPPG